MPSPTSNVSSGRGLIELHLLQCAGFTCFRAPECSRSLLLDRQCNTLQMGVASDSSRQVPKDLDSHSWMWQKSDYLATVFCQSLKFASGQDLVDGLTEKLHCKQRERALRTWQWQASCVFVLHLSWNRMNET
eukprot:520710-Amphidinium_carterae.1